MTTGYIDITKDLWGLVDQMFIKLEELEVLLSDQKSLEVAAMYEIVTGNRFVDAMAKRLTDFNSQLEHIRKTKFWQEEGGDLNGESKEDLQG